METHGVPPLLSIGVFCLLGLCAWRRQIDVIAVERHEPLRSSFTKVNPYVPLTAGPLGSFGVPAQRPLTTAVESLSVTAFFASARHSYSLESFNVVLLNRFTADDYTCSWRRADVHGLFRVEGG